MCLGSIICFKDQSAEAEVTGVSFVYRLQMIEVLIRGVVTGPRGMSSKVATIRTYPSAKLLRGCLSLSVITKQSEQLLQPLHSPTGPCGTPLWYPQVPLNSPESPRPLSDSRRHCQKTLPEQAEASEELMDDPISTHHL